MWHGAALIRSQKKMPPLKQFMSGKKQVKGIDECAIIDRLKAYNIRIAKESKNDSTP